MLNNQKELILLEDLGYLFPKEDSKRTRHYAKYKCHCGNEFKALTDNVKSGKKTSCGCLRFAKSSQSMSSHRLYKTWYMMFVRCYRKNAQNYKYYGGNGVTVCDEWKDLKTFIEDMYPSYKEGLTLDRIDNQLGYSKDNCRWSTLEVQNRNKRKLISTNKSGYRGVHWNKALNKWVSRIKINKKTIILGYHDTPSEGGREYDKYVTNNNLEHTKNF